MSALAPPPTPVFRAAHAQGESWQEVTRRCLAGLAPMPAGANLGFVYATDALAAELPLILDRLRSETPIRDWVGSLGLGVCGMAPGEGEAPGEAREYFAGKAMALLVAALPADSFRRFGPEADSVAALDAAHGTWRARVRPMLGIVHGDPRQPRLPALVAGLAHDAELFLVGGLAAASAAPLQVAGRVVENGLSGVLVAPEVAVATGLTQGCTPIGPVRPVTDAERHVLATIDGRAALDVFKEDIGELLSRDLRRVGGLIFAALPVRGSDTGDYVVRNLVSIDRMRGTIGIAGEVAPGDRIMFCRRDPASAATDMKRMLAQLKRRSNGVPRAGLYFSCVARGPNLFAAEAREIATIREVLGEFPLAGFFGNGEISHDRIYAYTGVLALFL